VCEDLEADFPPGQKDVGMMSDGLGDFSDAIGEIKGLAKIIELVGFFQMMISHDFPTLAKFLGKFRRFGGGEWLRGFVTGRTLFFS